MASLHHRDEGPRDGSVVLLLHAGVADLRMWDHLAADLVASGRRVVRCDLRGHGSTPLPPGCSYGDAEDVLALVDELGLTSYALVGASYGGYVAQQVATATPERVERLLLLDAPADLVAPDEELRAFWLAEGELLETGDLAGATELNLDTWLGPEASDELQAQVRLMQRNVFEVHDAAGEVESRELPVRLDLLTMPVTAVAGAHDLAFFRDNAAALAEQVPTAELVVLDRAGHLPALERPDEVAALVRGFLA